MPGCGKSSVGVLLAKELCKAFVDTDLIIQEKENKPLQDLLDLNGAEQFEKIEESAILSITPVNCVVATGGSAVYSEKSMNHLKCDSIIIFLDCKFNLLKKRIKNFSTRGVVLPDGKSFKDVYDERYPLYTKYADYVISCTNSPVSKSVEDIISLLKKEGLYENL
jgi:shikimate kinase